MSSITITDKKLKAAIHWYMNKEIWDNTKENNITTKKAKKILQDYVDGKLLLLVKF